MRSWLRHPRLGSDRLERRSFGGFALLSHGAEQAASLAPRAEDMYLDLLKRCLTRDLFEDALRVPQPSGRLRRWLYAALSRLLAGLGLVPARRVSREARAEGRDWLADAETMIGLRRLDNLEHCIRTVLSEGVPGDLVECGVWRGGAGIFMRGALAALGDGSRQVWLADSFQGLPAPDPRFAADAEDVLHTRDQLAVPLAEVRANFARYGLLDERVRFLQGWFADTLVSPPFGSLAVLRADGDMYKSTRDILDNLYDRVSPGGFVIIDDYGAMASCRQATDEFRSERGIAAPLVTIDWTGVYWRKER